MLLTDEERLKFAKYCETQVDSAKQMMEATKELPISISGAVQAKFKMEIAAFTFVYKHLIECESVTIKG